MLLFLFHHPLKEQTFKTKTYEHSPSPITRQPRNFFYTTYWKINLIGRCINGI